ncbi:MAG: hypothetical protein ACQETH_00700 [Candidatus Rifleibacteriota bacterium]
MNYLNEKEITFGQFKQVALQHYGWALICIISLLFLESFFFIYPPRGFVAEDFVTLGSIKGQPLLSIDSLWQSKISDDIFMLDILDGSEIKRFKNRVEKLRYIENNLRPNLHFTSLNKTIFKITFIQPSAEKIRPFLNVFTKKFLDQVALISREQLQNRRRNANFFYRQLLRRNALIHSLFKPTTKFEKIIPDQKSRIDNVFPQDEDSWLGKIGLITINELNKYLFRAQTMLKDYTDEQQKILSLFPFTHKRLTDPEMPPKPVQPFLFVFHIFVVIAIFLIYIAGLFYYFPFKDEDKS